MLFFRYLSGSRWLFGALALFAAIFASVFCFYHLPLAAVIYPTLLCAMLGVIFLLLGYGRMRRRYRALERLTGLEVRMIADLPEAVRPEDEAYQALIRHMQQAHCALESASGAAYQDMVNYYTLWAHQIKTPIASMRLQLQDQDSAASRQLQADLTRIEQYVEMVLAFLRLDSESSDYAFKKQPLDPIIRQTVKKFSSEFIGRKIGLQYQPVKAALITDEKWLAFVLEQIISNALKYTRGDGPAGHVKIYMPAPQTLCIEDNGIGIAPEDLPRIFEKGYTGYNGRSDKKASGIGLYLCKRVCDGLGIGIAADSVIGQGTTVTLRFDQHETRKE